MSFGDEINAGDMIAVCEKHTMFAGKDRAGFDLSVTRSVFFQICVIFCATE